MKLVESEKSILQRRILGILQPLADLASNGVLNNGVLTHLYTTTDSTKSNYGAYRNNYSSLRESPIRE